jgi:hypothetical protein
MDWDEEFSSSDWDEAAQRVTRAFNDWKLAEPRLRTFLSLGLGFLTEGVERTWEEIGRRPALDDGLAQIDVFDEEVGLYPQDFEWMHAAGVLRDAVSAFEVYLEKAREEVRRAHGHDDVVEEQAPHWGQLRSFFLDIGVEIQTADVAKVRDLRHFLTHRRGELRTPALRRQFASEHVMPPLAVEMSEAQVIAAMDVLAAVVRSVDPAAWRYSWGRQRSATLPPS